MTHLGPKLCSHQDAEIWRSMFERLRSSYHGHRSGGKVLVAVRVEARDPINEAGKFLPYRTRPNRANIYIFRQPGQAGCPVDELCTLCHELGHWRSWLEGNHSAEYNSAISTEPRSSLPPHAKHLILDEERRAWDYGRSFAAEAGFNDRWAYDLRARLGVGNHLARLQLADAPDPVELFP